MLKDYRGGIKMDNKKIITLDNKLLKPMKQAFEHSIDLMIKNALINNRDTEVNVKVLISTSEEVNADGEVYTSPRIQYKVVEKIKEPKADYKGYLDCNFAISLDDENNIVVRNVDEQQTLFNENDEDEDTEEDEDEDLWRKDKK